MKELLKLRDPVLLLLKNRKSDVIIHHVYRLLVGVSGNTYQQSLL